MESTDGCTVTAGIPMVSWVGPRASRVQAIAAGVVCAIALLVAAPNFFSARTVATTWPGWLPDRQIRLGIEYSGGHSLLLEPDMNFVQRELMSELRDKVRKALRKRRVRYEDMRSSAGGILLRFIDPERISEGVETVRRAALDADRMPVGSAPGYTVQVAAEGRIVVHMTDALKSALKERVLRQRLDALRCEREWLSASREGDAIRLVLPPNFREMAHLYWFAQRC